jgi:ribA/ribD-fused uncharacterized protein
VTLKFSQNEGLKDMLLKTGEKYLVEAAPKDKLWGIGLAMSDPDIVKKRGSWGNNIHGKNLMKVRSSLREQHTRSSTDHQRST